MVIEAVVVGAIVEAIASLALELAAKRFGKENVFAVASKLNKTFKNVQGPGADRLRKVGAEFFETFEAATKPTGITTQPTNKLSAVVAKVGTKLKAAGAKANDIVAKTGRGISGHGTKPKAFTP